jgi:hypothetical protein
VRVPTWCPFRLQIYLDGHHRLACRLERKQIGHTRLDNAFVQIDDRAQKIADDWPVEKLHHKLGSVLLPGDPLFRGALSPEFGAGRVLSGPAVSSPAGLAGDL